MSALHRTEGAGAPTAEVVPPPPDEMCTPGRDTHLLARSVRTVDKRALPLEG